SKAPRPKPLFYFCSAAILIVLGVTIWFEKKPPFAEYLSDLYQAAPMMIVPFLVMLSFQLRKDYIPPSFGSTAPVFVNLVFVSLILAAYSLVVILKTPNASFSYQGGFGALTCFVLGTLASAVGAHAVFQEALRHSTVTGGYVASFNFLIP